MTHRKEISIGEDPLLIQSGRPAKQADGSCEIRLRRHHSPHHGVCGKDRTAP